MTTECATNTIDERMQAFIDLSIQRNIFYRRWFNCVFPRLKRWLFKRRFEDERFELRNATRWYQEDHVYYMLMGPRAFRRCDGNSNSRNA